MSVICTEFLLTELAVRTWIFLKLSHANLTHDHNFLTVITLAHIIVLWQIKNLSGTVPFLLCLFVFCI